MNCQVQNILEKPSHLGLFTGSSCLTCLHVLALTRPSSEDVLSILLPHSWVFTVVLALLRSHPDFPLGPGPLQSQVSVLWDT